jgi:hypothetical protein
MSVEAWRSENLRRWCNTNIESGRVLGEIIRRLWKGKLLIRRVSGIKAGRSGKRPRRDRGAAPHPRGISFALGDQKWRTLMIFLLTFSGSSNRRAR